MRSLLRLVSCVFCLAIIAVLLTRMESVARAERPAASALLPEDTLAYLRMADVPETVKRFRETSIGRIARDPSMQPLIEQLYGSMIEEFRQVEERIGASLDELLSLPRGEVCAAVVQAEEGPPAVVILIEARERAPILNTVLDSIEQQIVERGGQVTEEENRRASIVMIQPPGNRQRQWVHCECDETIILSNNLGVVQDILAAWDGKAKDRLQDNPDFKSIIQHCAGPHETTPDVVLYVDAIDLFARLTRDNLGAQATLALFPALGLDGVRGLGGALLFASDDYDSIAHLHLLLDSPREGVLEMLAMQSGDVTPEPWVPEDVVRYMTVHWNVPQTYSALNRVFDQLRGEGEFAAMVENNMSREMGVDFKKDIIDNLDGRLTYLTWMVKPARMNSQATLVGLQLKDAEAFEKTFSKIRAKAGGELREEKFAGVTYYQPPGRRRPQNQERPLIREPDPAFAVIGDYLLMTDSSDLLKHVIATKKGNSASLTDALEYRLVASKIRSFPNGASPGMVIFNRPEEGLRLMYELATSDPLRQGLSRRGENNRFLGSVNQAMNDNPLPPFSVIAKYLAPGGSLAVSDASGLHMTTFILRRK